MEDVFAIVLPVAKGGSHRSVMEYFFNADKGAVYLRVSPSSSSPLNGIGAPGNLTNQRRTEGLDRFDLNFKVNSTSTYQASNAYGATVTVEKTDSTTLGIAVNQNSFSTLRWNKSNENSSPRVVFFLENGTAEMELPTLKALVVMKMADPYVLYNFFYSEPTRDMPNDITSQAKYLTGNVMGVVIYSGITGEIFARVPDDFGMPEPKDVTK